MPAQGADADGAIGVDVVVAQSGDVVDVDEHLGRCEPQLQHGDQTLSSSEHLGLAAPFVQQADRLFERTRCFVAEP